MRLFTQYGRTVIESVMLRERSLGVLTPHFLTRSTNPEVDGSCLCSVSLYRHALFFCRNVPSKMYIPSVVIINKLLFMHCLFVSSFLKHSTAICCQTIFNNNNMYTNERIRGFYIDRVRRREEMNWEFRLKESMLPTFLERINWKAEKVRNCLIRK